MRVRFSQFQREFGSFDRYVWAFVGGTPVLNRRRTLATVPARTPLSDALSKDLGERGFRFVGSTIMYAFMQATGLVNDHLVSVPALGRVYSVRRSALHRRGSQGAFR